MSDASASTFYAKHGLHVELRRDANGGFTFYGEDFGRAGGSDYEYWIGVEPGEFGKIRKALGEDDDRDILDQVREHAEDIMACGESTWLTDRGIQFSFHSWGEPPINVSESAEGKPGNNQRDGTLDSPRLIEPCDQATDDHYFETRFADADGADVPPTRYRTREDATARAEDLSLDGGGSIWYRNESSDPPIEMVRYNEDWSIIDGSDDSDTNYPLQGVPDSIEPGVLMFSLWLHDADGRLAPYDFGFEWDGAHEAIWDCSIGEGPGPTCGGTINWAGHDEDGEQEDSEDQDLGDDLQVSYTASSATGEVSGATLFKNGALDPIRTGDWVATARELFAFLRGQKLI